VIDAETNGVVATVPVRPYPYDLTVDPTTSTIYTPSYTGNSVDLVDGNWNAVGAVIPAVGQVPNVVAMNAITQHLYVGLHNESALREVDVGNIPFSFVRKISLGSIPQALAVNAANGRVYAALGNGSIAEIDAGTGDIAATIPIGPNPRGLRLGSANLMYAIADGSLKVIDTSTRSVVRTVPTGRTPWGLAFNPLTRSIFVANLDDDTVSVIDGMTYGLVATIPVGRQPSGVAVIVPTGFASAAENRVFVTNSADGTVSSFRDPVVGGDLITVPLRWCAVEGSSAATGIVPTGQMWMAGNSEVDAALLGLLRAASDEVWMAGNTRIALRSANAAHLPIIADPRPPTDRTQELGDIDVSNIASELKEAVDHCRSAWDNLYPGQRGTIVINLRKYIWGGGAVGNSAEVASPLQTGGARSSDLCAFPRRLMISDVAAEWASVEDSAIQLVYGANAVTTLAHEIGHTLFLGHGNGFDDDGNGVQPPTPGSRFYDQYCDPKRTGEDTLPLTSCEESQSLMGSGTYCRNLRPLQIETARDAAALVPGAISASPDPWGEWSPKVERAREHSEVPQDLEIVGIGVAQAPHAETTELSLRIRGPLRSDVGTVYAIFADLDTNLQTGCLPSSLGIPTKVGGAEMAARVTIRPRSTGRKQDLAVWMCRGGKFRRTSGEEEVVSAFDQTMTGSRGQGFSVISIRMPKSAGIDSLRTIRVQAVSGRSGLKGRAYVVPLDWALIDLVPPILPGCSTTPSAALPGSTVATDATDLLANRLAGIYLGDQQVATATANANGALTANWVVPSGAAGGLRPVSLVSVGSAITAVCPIRIVAGQPQQASSRKLTAVLTVVDAARVLRRNAEVTLTTTIRSDSGVAVTSVPADLLFDDRYLEFVRASTPPDSVMHDRIEWDDLTSSAKAAMFLEAGASLGISATFRVIGCPAGELTSVKVESSGAVDARGQAIPRVSTTQTLRISCGAVKNP
jgi:YVTN family beta-propeller protein